MFNTQNIHGDTFLHYSIRNERSQFTMDMLTYFMNRQNMVLTPDEQAASFPLDVENGQERCTPYMLAVLREQFDVADFLQDQKLSNIAYKNQNNESVFDKVNRLKIKGL